MIVFVYFSFLMYISHFTLGQGWLLSNHLIVKHVKTVFVQVLNLCSHSTQWQLCGCMELMLCCESSRKCHHAAQTPTWTKTILTMFYKIDCRAATHGWIWMNNVPKWKYNNYAIIALKSVLLYLFLIFKYLESNLGFPCFYSFFFNTHTVYPGWALWEMSVTARSNHPQWVKVAFADLFMVRLYVQDSTIST